MNYFDIALQCLIVLFLAFANSCLTYFYTFAIGEPHKGEAKIGRVFSRLGLWLDMKYEAFENKQNIRFAEGERKIKQSLPKDFLNQIARLKMSRRLNVYKALGLCPICSNIWFGFITLPITFYFFELNWLLLLPAIVISNQFVRDFMRKGG